MNYEVGKLSHHPITRSAVRLSSPSKPELTAEAQNPITRSAVRLSVRLSSRRSLTVEA